MVICYRRFGTTHRSHIEGSRTQEEVCIRGGILTPTHGRGIVHSLIIYTSFRRNNIIILSVISHLPSKYVGLLAKEMELESNSCDMVLLRVMTSTGYMSRVHVTLSLFAEVMSFVLSDCCQVQLQCSDINVWTAIYLWIQSRVSADVRGFGCSLQKVRFSGLSLSNSKQLLHLVQFRALIALLPTKSIDHHTLIVFTLLY